MDEIFLKTANLKGRTYAELITMEKKAKPANRRNK